jgi:hypothetical protein
VGGAGNKDAWVNPRDNLLVEESLKGFWGGATLKFQEYWSNSKTRTVRATKKFSFPVGKENP